MANQDEFRAFKQWYDNLPTVAKPTDWYTIIGLTASNFRNSAAYKRWQELGTTAGTTTGTEQKAKQFAQDQMNWQQYRSSGGDMDLTAWLRAGKPASAQAQQVQNQLELPTAEDLQQQSLEDVNMQAWLNYRSNGGTLGYEDWKTQGYPSFPGSEGTQRDYAAELQLERDRLAQQQRQFEATEGINPYEQAMLDYQQKQFAEQQRQFDLQQQYLQQQLQQQAQQQQQMLDWYREQQQAELEAERQQQLANLRANPASWLEYASLAGETPAVQPWMVPLSPKDYNLQAGQELPGWNPEGESLSGLPELKTPSAQYVARIAPSARAQYGGYEQARTGATPEDVSWLLGSKVAPPGGNSGLKWIR